MSFLGLFGGNESSSTSSTSETIYNTTPTLYANNGSDAISAVTYGNGDVNITSSNPAVAMHAMDTALTATQDALLFGDSAMRQSYSFATGVNNSAFAQIARDNEMVMAAAGAANQRANDTASKAMTSAETAYQNALKFGSMQTGVALDALAGSASMIDTAYKDAKGVLGTNVILVAIGAGVLVMYFALGRKH